jgi:hypothetical protein
MLAFFLPLASFFAISTILSITKMMKLAASIQWNAHNTINDGNQEQ